MNETPRKYRALVLCRVRQCPTCAREVTVHNDRCDECGRTLRQPIAAVTAQPRRTLTVLPATSFGVAQAAAVIGSIEVAVAFNLN